MDAATHKLTRLSGREITIKQNKNRGVLARAVQCRQAVLCCAVLCCAVLCCAVLTQCNDDAAAWLAGVMLVMRCEVRSAKGGEGACKLLPWRDN